MCRWHICKLNRQKISFWVISRHFIFILHSLPPCIYKFPRNSLPPISVTTKYQTTTFHGSRRKSETNLPSVVINENITYDAHFADPRATWSAESKSRSESCLSDGYFSGAAGGMSVNTAYSDLEVLKTTFKTKSL